MHDRYGSSCKEVCLRSLVDLIIHMHTESQRGINYTSSVENQKGVKEQLKTIMRKYECLKYDTTMESQMANFVIGL